MVGDKYIIIYSFSELVNGNNASSARMMNYARALSVHCKVILLSFERRDNISFSNLRLVEDRIYTAGNNHQNIKSKFQYFKEIFFFVKKINTLIDEIGDSQFISLLLYPQYRVTLDIISLLYFRLIKKRKLFCEINEIRQYGANILEIKPQGLKIWLIKKWLINKHRMIERLSKYYSGLICISTNIEKHYRRYNPNTIRVPIMADRLHLPIETKKLSECENLKIGFFGSVDYYKENLEVLFSSLEKLVMDYKVHQFEIDFYGFITDFTLKKINGLNNNPSLCNKLKYGGMIGQSKVRDKMKTYHLLVLPRGNNLQNKYGFSTKLSEYLSTGVPVLITDVSDNGMYIKDNVNGFIVAPDNAGSFAEKLFFIFQNYNEYAPIVSEGAIKTTEEEFLFVNYSDKLFEFLSND